MCSVWRITISRYYSRKYRDAFKARDPRLAYEQVYRQIPFSLGNLTLLIIFLYQNTCKAPTSKPGNLQHLSLLDLSNNQLSGTIPKEIAYSSFSRRLESLENLNLSFNRLEGEVPVKGSSKMQLEFQSKEIMDSVGVFQHCTCPHAKEDHTKRESGSTTENSDSRSWSSLCVSLLFSFFILRHKQKSKKNNAPIVTPLEDQFPRVSYTELVRATDGFSSTNLIGRGGYGSVYKGILGPQQTIVAVKVFNLQYRGASKSFLAECEVLKSARHRNLVKIMTSCSMVDFRGNDFKALIFEFIPNRSLENWLHPELDQHNHLERLSLLQRLNIAIDVAEATDYLHNNCRPAIVHCDLKPSNILLDNEMVAHVGDFGLARFISKATPSSLTDKNSSIRIRGSLGYIAPGIFYFHLYLLGSYYGILLLEILTGKRPVDDIFKDGLSLRKFVEIAFSDRIITIVDPLMPLAEEERMLTLELEFIRRPDETYVEDFARDLDRRRSLTGYVFSVGGCAVSWKATLQSTVALSTTEVEFMAATEAVKEAMWLRGLFGELSVEQKETIIYCDS
ncbi:probable LRR receptor-like serine/threonine-protein kinase At3g47570 [Elaeis guineensis]|uniref:probable LRR receptor-like serine/threonine-protein kinase At3g47570 n=1 Tax=Elaeis guineensis var. tenera TaxID=51953 RepID=UPI003C6CC585